MLLMREALPDMTLFGAKHYQQVCNGSQEMPHNVRFVNTGQKLTKKIADLLLAIWPRCSHDRHLCLLLVCVLLPAESTARELVTANKNGHIPNASNQELGVARCPSLASHRVPFVLALGSPLVAPQTNASRSNDIARALRSKSLTRMRTAPPSLWPACGTTLHAPEPCLRVAKSITSNERVKL